MSTPSPMTLENALRLYAVEVDHWWDGAGDSDQMLSAREWIEDRADSLSEAQRKTLMQLDEKVTALAAPFQVAGSWDVSMLKKTAQLAAKHHASA
jgi:hypothetical protein